jgi:Txe/YoeB family toxin of Txe-Axe toxin-antitoxin module
MKPSKVKFISDGLKMLFETLDDNDPVKKSIKRAIRDLQADAFFGTQLPKRLFPEEYLKKYNINNLWKYDLPNAWRLIYTITAENEVEIVCAILDWFNHKNYERKFKY